MWLAASALALPPDQERALLPIGVGAAQVERMVVAPSGDFVVGRTRGDLRGWLLDVDTFALHTFGADCEVTGVAPLELGDGSAELWTSCGDGRVIVKTWDGTRIGDLVDDEGLAVSYDIDDSLSGIFDDPISGWMYAVSVEEGALGQLHVIDPWDKAFEAVDGAVAAAYPTALPWRGFDEGVVVDGRLIVTHGGVNELSATLLGTNPVAVIPQFPSALACLDLAPSPFGGVYCVDDVGQAADWRPAAGGILNVLPLGVLPSPRAICVSEDITDGWVAVTGEQVKVWEMLDSGTVPSPIPYFEGPPQADNPIQDMVTRSGYLYGGGLGGNLHIVTARPWVEQITVMPANAQTGDEVTVTLQIDEDSTWTLHRGGDRLGSGPQIASGDVNANQVVSVNLTVGDGFIEGVNHLYLVATNDLGLTGHRRGSISVDNPPGPPQLNASNVAFGDGQLVLSFDGIPDADLDHYSVFVSASDFNGADFETGGPDFDGSTSLMTPIELEALGGDRVSKTIHPLENDVTYYIGVRAWDQGGKEGPMSRVIQGTPREAFTAAELAGERGGSACATGAGGAGWLALGLGLLAVRRRGTVAAVALCACMLPAVASAEDRNEDEDRRGVLGRDMTPARANFEVRYGVINLADENIDAVYGGKPTNLLQAEIGPQLWRVAEVDLGFGFLQTLAHTVDSSGAASGDRTMLTWWPLALDVTLRGHILDEQPIVPHVRLGYDYVIWSELSDQLGGGKRSVKGAKSGTHTALGASILLDLAQPGRASLLEAQTGINDTWITFEWRRQSVDARSRPWSGATEGGLDFSGNAFMVGLKLDY